MEIKKSAQQYIDKYNLNTTPELLMKQFQLIIELHKDFNKYLKTEKLNQKLEKMNRSQRLLEKRRLFAEWYTLNNQNKKMVKEILIDVSEMVFASTKTVQKDLLGNKKTSTF
ncbi:hypothetical protein [Tamlana sp. I1]|uniref:hypothetical protein n=1 Tax=Tamlana sp. I1 TaxID=2762061 RepID=UPI0018907CA3|nr:hypothetical protein [Tamlana sp. I1]